MLEKVKSQQLLQDIKKKVEVERRSTYVVLKYLQEIEKRKCYAELGYNSLFSYCTKELLYSEAQASIRISAMRLLRKSKVVEAKIKTGDLSLSVAAEVQRKTKGQKVDLPKLIDTISGLPTRAAEKKIREALPIKTERIKQITLRERILKLMDEYDSSKSELEIIEELLVEKVTQIKSKRKTPIKEKNSRYIPIKVKEKTQHRSGMQCEHVGAHGRCQEKRFLEFDHQIPYSRGGMNSEANIRHLCRFHNQLKGAS